jgi:hypothetical protein
LNVHSIDPAGRHACVTLGPDPDRGHRLQAAVGARSFFGAALQDRASYTLVSCVCAPGFEFEDLETPDRQSLLSLFPQHAALIKRLTRA